MSDEIKKEAVADANATELSNEELSQANGGGGKDPASMLTADAAGLVNGLILGIMVNGGPSTGSTVGGSVGGKVGGNIKPA